VPDDPSQAFRIVSVYPNPLSGSGGRIVFFLPVHGEAWASIWTLRGELVFSWQGSGLGAGNQSFPWDCNNSSGQALSYGNYYLQMKDDRGGQDGRWICIVR
jgi:hypothetical protein